MVLLSASLVVAVAQVDTALTELVILLVVVHQQRQRLLHSHLLHTR